MEWQSVLVVGEEDLVTRVAKRSGAARIHVKRMIAIMAGLEVEVLDRRIGKDGKLYILHRSRHR